MKQFNADVFGKNGKWRYEQGSATAAIKAFKWLATHLRHGRPLLSHNHIGLHSVKITEVDEL